MPWNRSLLYHLTPHSNRFAIRERGLLISHDARKVGRIWLCEHKLLRYIGEHLTERDGFSFALYSVVEVRTWMIEDKPKKCGRDGIFYTEKDVCPEAISLGFTPMMIDLDPVQPTGEDLRNIRKWKHLYGPKTV